MIRSATAAVTLTMAAACVADELWRQNPIDSFGGLASQDARNPGGPGFFAEAADNFTAQAGWSIAGIEFWGGYAQVTPGTMHGFMVRFYRDAGGTVGALLSTQDVMSFTEVLYYTSPAPLSIPGYRYTLNLVTSYSIQSDGPYWISVVAILDRGGTSNNPQWGWVLPPRSPRRPPSSGSSTPARSPRRGSMSPSS